MGNKLPLLSTFLFVSPLWRQLVSELEFSLSSFSSLSSFIFSHTSASCCKISFFLYSANRSSISISLAVVSTGFAEPKTFSEDTPHDLMKLSDLFDGFSSNSASGCATISGRGSVRGFKFNFGLSCTDSSINDKALEDCLFGETSGILERLPALQEPGLLMSTLNLE
uniref:Uncharacterized protein n=1 Tax=Glossina pallidipes TaxID=7398 RepID=A0A1A9ZXK2_GLOPL